MEFPADEALAVGEGHLVDEDYAVFTASYDVSSAWRSVYTRNFATVRVDGLLDDVVEDRVEDL